MREIRVSVLKGPVALRAPRSGFLSRAGCSVALMEQRIVYVEGDTGEAPTGEVCSGCGLELSIMEAGTGEASLWCGCGALVVLS